MNTTGNTKVQFVAAPVFFPSPALSTPRMAPYAGMQFINEEAITETIYAKIKITGREAESGLTFMFPDCQPA